jgi:peroxiredoxin
MPHRLTRVVPVAALVLATLLVVLLGMRTRDLQGRYDDLLQQTMRAYPGYVVPTFSATTLDGDTVLIGENAAGFPQVLFFFTTTCPFCRDMVPVWSELAESLNGGEAEVFGIALDSVHLVREYHADFALPYPVVIMSDRKVAAIYRISAVPFTLVVDDAGEVVFARYGLIDSRAAMDSVITAARSVRESRYEELSQF